MVVLEIEIPMTSVVHTFILFFTLKKYHKEKVREETKVIKVKENQAGEHGGEIWCRWMNK